MKNTQRNLVFSIDIKIAYI